MYSPLASWGAGFDLFTQGVSLGEQLNGVGEQLLVRAVMTEGQLLGDETVEFGRKIGRHVGLFAGHGYQGLGGPSDLGVMILIPSGS